MTLLTRLFAGRHWTMRIALAALLLSAVASLALLAPQRGYTATDGTMLTYDISTLGDPRTILPQLRSATDDFAQSLGDTVEISMLVGSADAAEQAQAAASQSAASLVAFYISSRDAALQSSFEAALAQALPGLAPPVTEVFTWFSEEGGLSEGTRISLKFDQNWQSFVFPADATQEKMNTTIQSWLKANLPELKVEVKVTVTGSGEDQCVNADVRSSDANVLCGVLVEQSGPGGWVPYE